MVEEGQQEGSTTAATTALTALLQAFNECLTHLCDMGAGAGGHKEPLTTLLGLLTSTSLLALTRENVCATVASSQRKLAAVLPEGTVGRPLHQLHLPALAAASAGK